MTGLAASAARLPETSSFGAFAFADSSGTRVLAVSPLRHPEQVHTLIVGGRQFPVRYDGKQQRSKQSDGRDRAYNFAHVEGDRFRLVGGCVLPDETAFLATDSLLALGGLPMRVERDGRPCAEQDGTRKSIESERGRRTLRCWRLANYGSDRTYGEVDLVEFVPQGRNWLASIYVSYSDGGPTWLTEDYAVTLSDSSSVWRVDDDGKIDEEAFDVLFILNSRSGFLMGLSWGGAEGESLELLSPRGRELVPIAMGYRYTAP